MIDLVGAPFDTARDTMAQFVAQLPEARPLGLAVNAVFQADTAESPSMRPFVVLRWGDEVAGLGGAWVRPLTMWVYDEFGDYNRASNIAKAIQRAGGEMFLPIATRSGWVNTFATWGSGLGIGGDLADDGFEALVVPLATQVMGRGD